MLSLLRFGHLLGFLRQRAIPQFLGADQAVKQDLAQLLQRLSEAHAAAADGRLARKTTVAERNAYGKFMSFKPDALFERPS
eukprot:12520550-Alexandrium_andersonii.AAC.1